MGIFEFAQMGILIFSQMGDFDFLRISILDNLWYKDIEYIILLVCIGFNPTSNEETLDIQNIEKMANADCIDINDSLYYFDNTPALTPCYNELLI